LQNKVRRIGDQIAVVIPHPHVEEADLGDDAGDGVILVEDANGNIFIKGRCKNMLLTASGQNIYPEEIEARLNNMPYVNESLVILKENKLVALVYPDNEDAFSQGMNKKQLEEALELNRIELNKVLPAYSQITQVKLYPEEFEKTAKKSIKRFLYQ
jgi:long-chain acyl-CoA synthetase